MRLSNSTKTQTTEKEMMQLKKSSAESHCKTCKPTSRFYSLQNMLLSGNTLVSWHSASSHQRHPLVYASLPLVPVHNHRIPQLPARERSSKQSSGHYERNTWLIFCFTENPPSDFLFYFSSPFEAGRVKSLSIPCMKRLHGLIPLLHNQINSASLSLAFSSHLLTGSLPFIQKQTLGHQLQIHPHQIRYQPLPSCFPPSTLFLFLFSLCY